MNHEKQSRKEIWQRHLSAARQFPGTVDAYCSANRITTTSFYYWKKKLERDRKAAMIPSAPNTPRPSGYDTSRFLNTLRFS